MKLTKTQTTIGILLILLIFAGSYVFDKEVIQPKIIEYKEQGAMSIIQEININGNIPVVNNKTIQWVSIQEICKQ